MRYRWDPPYPGYRARSIGSAGADIRASDAERNDVAEKLSHHYADGRLDQVEFKARLDRAMGATTRGDLGGLFDDLPPLVEEAPPPRPRRRRLVPLVLLFVVVVLAAGWSFPYVHVPWLLLVLVGLFLWRRAERHDHRHSHHDAHQ
jgi:Domain of unknown function (DUF1707)